MQFEVVYLADLDDEFEELDAEFVEAVSWLQAVEIGEASANRKKKFLAQLSRLE